MTVTIDELRNEVQKSIAKISLNLKQIHEIGQQVAMKAEQCDADPVDVMLVVMTYINSVREMEKVIHAPEVLN